MARRAAQAWLPEIGLYHYKARIYSATLGRFLQTDPIGYAYVGNDPVNGRDPSGLASAIVTGTRIPSRGDNGICSACSGFSFAGPSGGSSSSGSGGGGGAGGHWQRQVTDYFDGKGNLVFSIAGD